MPLDSLQSIEAIEAMENLLEKLRPPIAERNKLDFCYRFDDQSVILFSLRPHFQNSTLIIETPIGKTTYIKSSKKWKIFWLRSNMKWESYGPNPTVKAIADFCNILLEDKYSCFFG